MPKLKLSDDAVGWLLVVGIVVLSFGIATLGVFLGLN